MNDTDDSLDLTGKLLIAMPGMGDPRFEKLVIYMCAHSPEGSMGLIINKPLPELEVSDLLDQLNIPKGNRSRDIRVQFGGPVEHGRGFVLHSSDYQNEETTLNVDEQIAMTVSLDILEELANGNGPDIALLMLGYSGWGPGQIEAEIVDNGWLVSDATPEIIFGQEADVKWGDALGILGIDPLSLSAMSGRA